MISIANACSAAHSLRGGAWGKDPKFTRGSRPRGTPVGVRRQTAREACDLSLPTGRGAVCARGRSSSCAARPGGLEPVAGAARAPRGRAGPAGRTDADRAASDLRRAPRSAAPSRYRASFPRAPRPAPSQLQSVGFSYAALVERGHGRTSPRKTLRIFRLIAARSFRAPRVPARGLARCGSRRGRAGRRSRPRMTGGGKAASTRRRSAGPRRRPAGSRCAPPSRSGSGPAPCI